MCGRFAQSQTREDYLALLAEELLMNRNVTHVTPWWLWRQRDRSRTKSSLIICAVLRIILVRGVLRDYVFNSTTTTGF